jgi:hypothetical protein
MDPLSNELNDRDFELLSQLVDGELDAHSRQTLERRLAAEPALASALAALHGLNSDLREALHRHPGVPPRIEDLLRAGSATSFGGGKVLPFPGQPAAQEPPRGWRRWPLAAAASVVLAAALAMQLLQPTDPASGLPGNDQRVAAALDTQPSGEGWTDLGDGRALQPVLTFAHRNGHWCREFLLRGGEHDWRAVACRTGQGWSTQAAGLESYLDGSDAYRPAGAVDSAPVAVFISQNAADIALDRDQENALIATGWR